jgi:hypothetical protein
VDQHDASRGFGRGSSAAHKDAVDAISVHINHLKSVTPSFEHITGARHSAESRHRETAERVVVLALIVTEQRLSVDRSQHGVEV